MVTQTVLNDLFSAFPDAILNRNLEFVADPHRRVNSYFRLDNCETRTDVVCKVLEYLSREAFKSQHFNAAWRNKEVHEYHLRGINTFCGTTFSATDIETVYTHLGNTVNRKLTLAFIDSGFDLAVLRKMPEIELQRCPNCGGPAKLHTKRGKFYYECDGDCWTVTQKHSTVEGAAREWNRLEKRVTDRECLFCRHSLSGDAPDGTQVLVCFCRAGYEGKETYVDDACENYSEAWQL